jgi:hypothetical protein
VSAQIKNAAAECSTAEMKKISYCYQFTEDEAGCLENTFTNDCHWCPSYLTYAGTRNLCRTKLSCNVKVHWDVITYDDFQNGCISPLGAGSTLAPRLLLNIILAGFAVAAARAMI